MTDHRHNHTARQAHNHDKSVHMSDTATMPSLTNRPAAQWQTPHLPEDHSHDHDRPDDEHRDLDLVEQVFVEALATTSDITSLLRLAGIPFEFARDGTTYRLLRVETQTRVDVGQLTPRLGGETFQYAPLPASLTSRRQVLSLVYASDSETLPLGLLEARSLEAK